MHSFESFHSRLENFKLTPALIEQLASQFEKLVLEPYQKQIVHHLMQGKSVLEVAEITGEPVVRVLWSAVGLVSQSDRLQPPDAPQTVRSPRRPPRTPLNAAAALEFSPEELLSAVAAFEPPRPRTVTEEAML